MIAWNEKDVARIKAASLTLDEIYKTIKDKNVYVAGPYGESLPFKIRQEHHEGMVKICARLIKKGVRAYAPIAYTYDIIMHGSRPPNGWYDFDLKMLPMFEYVLLLLLPGWGESVGMKLEEEAAEKHGIPVFYVKI